MPDDDVEGSLLATAQGGAREDVVVYLYTLGAAAIKIGATRLGPASARMFSALLFLTVERGHEVSRETLGSLLFPCSRTASASHNVRQLVYKLRLAGAPLEGDGGSITLPANMVSDDYSPFLAGRHIGDEDLDRIASGFLPGFTPDFSDPYGEWLEIYRNRITLKLRQKLVLEIARLRSAANWDRVPRIARACLGLDPMNEEATLALAEVLALSGSKVEAVSLLDKYLAELDGKPHELKVPAAILRRRIAERFPTPVYRAAPQAPLIGREAEMADLSGYLRLAKAGQPQTVLVSGNAGIGKSRLISEFSKLAVLDGAVVKTVTLQPHDKRRPMSVFVDLAPELRSLPGALGAAPESLQLLARITAVQPIGAKQTSAPRPAIIANITRAIGDILDAVSSEAPLVVMVEDAQWVDQLSLTALTDLNLQRTDRRVLTLLAWRDALFLSESALQIGSKHVPLGPLNESDSQSLIRSLLHGTPGSDDAPLQQWCIRNSGGNPYFLHALATHYAATAERFSVPATLTDLLRQRLERLDERTATVFDACILLGKHATVSRLREVMCVSALELGTALRILDDGGFVHIEGDHLQSSHCLLSDIATSRIPSSVATLLHGEIAKVLQATNDDEQDASVLWDAAEHFYRAGDRDTAADILESRARRAIQIGQPQFAVELYCRALDFSVSATRQVSTAKRIIESATASGDWPKVLSGMTLLRKHGHLPPVESETHTRYELLEYDAARLCGADRTHCRDQLVRCVQSTTSDADHRIQAARRLFMVAEDSYSADDARMAYSIAQEVANDSGGGLEFTLLEMMYHTTFGDHSRASSIARNVLADSTQLPGASETRNARFNAAMSLYRCGEIQEAQSAVRNVYDSCVETGQAAGAHWAAALLATFCIDRGDLEETRRWLAIADAADVMSSFSFVASGYMSTVVRLALLEGRVSDAEAVLDRSLRDYPALSTGRNFAASQALRIRIRQLKGRPASSAEDLESLLRDHVRSASVGLCDELTAILWHALAELDRHDDADSLLNSYLNHLRKDGFPPSIEIQQILQNSGSITATPRNQSQAKQH